MARPEDELVRQVGEALDLLFPLGFERGGRDYEGSAGLAEAVQQRTSGDGLDRFAEAHFVRQQRAFAEGQMQHAFALVREQRNFRLVHGPFAALHLQFVFVSELLALGGPPAIFQPG